MNLNKLNQWLSLLANIGVLAGIVFLAIEINQNSQLIRSQTRDSMAAKNIEFRYETASNPAFLSAYVNGREIMSGPTFDEEFFTLAWIFDARFKIWENEWYQYEQGLFDEEEFQGRLQEWKFTLERQLPMRAYWEIRRDTYSESFTSQLDSIISELTRTL